MKIRYGLNVLFIFAIFTLCTAFNISEDNNIDTKYIINRILETDKNNKFIRAEIYNYSKGNYKDGKKVNYVVESRVLGELTLKKPYPALFKVIESTNPMAVGAKLLYKGGEDVKVRASGLFGFIPLTFKISDPMFRNSRNHKFTFDGLASIRDPKADVSIITSHHYNNKITYLLKVVSPTKADPEITHEIYKVDGESFVVVSIRMYVDKEMVSEYSINNLNNKIVKDDDIFRI